MPKLVSGPDIPETGVDVAGVTRADTTDVSAGYHALAAGFGDLATAARDLQARERQAEAKEADLWAAEQISTLLYDPDSGYLSKRKKDAVGAYDDFVKGLDTVRTSALGRVRDDRARELLDLELRDRVRRAKDAGGRHLYDERVVLIDATAEAHIARAQRDMASAPGDYGAMSSSLDTIEGQTRERMRLRGAGPEETEGAVYAARSVALTALIDATAETDPITAESLFSSVSDQLDPTIRGELGERVRRKRDQWQYDRALEKFDTSRP